MIKYSIIIPHHNIPKLLERCLKSIPDRSDIQIIVVDDNSINNERYLSEYDFLHRDNLIFIPTKEGRGAGYARNIGLSHAKGKWLLFADADDFFYYGFDKLLDRLFDSNDDVIYFNVKSVYSDDITKEGGRDKAKSNLFNRYKVDADDTSFRLNYPEPWGKMVRNQLVIDNNIKFDETRVANDYYFSTQVGCLAKTICVVDSPLYVITLRRDSLSFNYGDSKEKLITRIEVGTRVYHFRKKYGYDVPPLPIRGLMVLLLKHYPLVFFKELFVLPFKGIPVFKLLCQIFSIKYMKQNG